MLDKERILRHSPEQHQAALFAGSAEPPLFPVSADIGCQSQWQIIAYVGKRAVQQHRDTRAIAVELDHAICALVDVFGRCRFEKLSLFVTTEAVSSMMAFVGRPTNVPWSCEPGIFTVRIKNVPGKPKLSLI